MKPIVTNLVLAQLPPNPRLLATKDELGLAKKRAQNTEWGKGYTDTLLKRCDEALLKPIALPDRGGQWPHWYACPKHGARLKTEGPTRHVCPTDGQVFTGYPYDDVLLLAAHNDYANLIRDLGMAWQLTGKRTYAEKARAILLAYAQKYPSYAYHDKNGKQGTGGAKVGPQTLDEAVWLIPVAQGADLIWETLTEPERETLKGGLFYPAVQVIRQHKLGVHNIQCWKNSAVGLVGFLYGDKELLADAIDDPERGLQRQLREGITDDGPWYEGAWSYHFYTMSALAPLAEAMHHAGLPIYSGVLGERYKKLYLAPIRMALPNGQLPAFNDSNTATATGNVLYETALARFKAPELAIPLVGNGRRTLPALLVGDALPAIPQNAAKTENFAASGYAYLRAPGAALILKYGPHGGGHGHPDKLNVVFQVNGKTLLDDPGTSAYGVPAHTGWYKTSVAHNTLVVDEQNQKPATGTLLALQTGEGWSAALAEVKEIYPGITFRRAAFLVGGTTAVFCDMVEDTAKPNPEKPRLYDLVIHPNVDPKQWLKFQADQRGGGESYFNPQKNTPGYSYLRDIKVSTAGNAYYFDPTGVGFFAPDVQVMVTGTGMGKSSEDRVPIVLLRGNRPTTVWAMTTQIPPKEADDPLFFVHDQNGFPLLTDELPREARPLDQVQVLTVSLSTKELGLLLVVNPLRKKVRLLGYSGSDPLMVVKLTPELMKEYLKRRGGAR